MFTKEELINLYIFLHERATFNMNGKETELFVTLKNRVAEEAKKLEAPEPKKD